MKKALAHTVVVLVASKIHTHQAGTNNPRKEVKSSSPHNNNA